LKSTVADIKAAEAVVDKVHNMNFKLEVSLAQLRLNFHEETSVMLTAVRSYLLALPALCDCAIEGTAGRSGSVFESGTVCELEGGASEGTAGRSGTVCELEGEAYARKDEKRGRQEAELNALIAANDVEAAEKKLEAIIAAAIKDGNIDEREQREIDKAMHEIEQLKNELGQRTQNAFFHLLNDVRGKQKGDRDPKKQLEDLKDQHKFFQSLLETYKETVVGLRVRNDEEFKRLENDVIEELFKRGAQVQEKADEVYKLLVLELFGADSPAHKALRVYGGTVGSLKLFSRLQEIREELCHKKILLEDLKLVSNWMYDCDDRSIYEAKAAKEEQKWNLDVAPHLVQHIYSSLERWQ
jgi:hypothetical protein